MRAHVHVQYRAMQLPQGRSRLRVMPMSGAVCQQRTPDPTGRDAEQGGKKGDGDGDTQAAAGESEGGTANATDAVDATEEIGERERQGKGRWAHGNNIGGRRDDGGRAGLHPYSGGPTSPGGLWRLGICQPWHPPGRRHPRQLGGAGVVARPCGHAIEAL